MKKGSKMPEETKRKISEAKKRLYQERPELLEEARAVMANARKAKQPATEETKKRLSEAGKKRYTDPVEREKQSQRMKEMWTDERKESVREERSKRWEDPDYRERVITANTGRKRKQATKSKISEKAKERWADPTFREKMKLINKEAAQKRDMSGENNGMYGKHHTEDARLKVTTALWKRVKDHLNPLELSVAKTLNSLNIKYEPQKIIGFYLVDFYIDDLNLIIEVDGSFWHDKPERKQRDKRRDAWLRSKGYKVIRLTELAIKTDPLTAVTTALNLNKQGPE